jgi:hypothetical protein
MTLEKIMVGDEMYSIFEHQTRKAVATAHAEIARRTGMFKSVRVIEVGKTHPYYKQGKYVVAVRGVAYVPKESASEMRKRLGAPERVEFNSKTGKITNW